MFSFIWQFSFIWHSHRKKHSISLEYIWSWDVIFFITTSSLFHYVPLDYFHIVNKIKHKAYRTNLYNTNYTEGKYIVKRGTNCLLSRELYPLWYQCNYILIDGLNPDCDCPLRRFVPVIKRIKLFCKVYFQYIHI